MLYVFGFERVCVAMSDLYFVDPAPNPGQEGAERGVRLEVRLLERDALQGSVYSAQPISVGRPLWRADLLERADGPAGTFDRTHHHPEFRGWEPGPRCFDAGMSASPVEWVGGQLEHLDSLARRAGVDPGALSPADAEALRRAVPEIVDALRRLLAQVHSGELAQPPPGEPAGAAARASWL